MPEVVRVDVSGHVAEVVLDRPEKLNAVSNDVFVGLYEAGRRIENDDDVRAVLIRGEGRAFCSGLDLASIGAIGGQAGAQGGGQAAAPRAVPSEPPASGLSPSHDGFAVWQRMGKPVVAAVHGYALGAGFQLALAADIRFCAEDATMSVFEITYGLVPDLGATKLLPELVGPARAKELIWTARRFSGVEAAEWGVANRAIPADTLLDEARAFVADLAARPPIPVRLAKTLVDENRERSLPDALRKEVEAQGVCTRSKDSREAIAASFEKRTPTFTGS